MSLKSDIYIVSFGHGSRITRLSLASPTYCAIEIQPNKVHFFLVIFFPLSKHVCVCYFLSTKMKNDILLLHLLFTITMTVDNCFLLKDFFVSSVMFDCQVYFIITPHLTLGLSFFHFFKFPSFHCHERGSGLQISGGDISRDLIERAVSKCFLMFLIFRFEQNYMGLYFVSVCSSSSGRH